jgi:hypothetical protein
MKEPSPPRGWNRLPESAQNECDPKKLAARMERLTALC